MSEAEFDAAFEKLEASCRKLGEGQTFMRQLLAAVVLQAGGEIVLCEALPQNPTILTHSDADGLHIKVKGAL